MNDEFFDEEVALSELLKNGVLFCNSRYYSLKKDTKSEGETIVLFVICNDVFAWGCADAEDLPLNELENFYKMWEKDKINGPIKWCCLRRNEKPQKPMVDLMKKEGAWDDELEKLSENLYDKIWLETNVENKL
jgi:hypothetical protein